MFVFGGKVGVWKAEGEGERRGLVRGKSCGIVQAEDAGTGEKTGRECLFVFFSRPPVSGFVGWTVHCCDFALPFP